ncbi:MAG: aminotransferase class V-fold PLP-dependent enzyme [Mesorhizobium sp.]|uniref:aminotransferase class V-fold PLP-dependent enzyme n=1 Tax=Mesorhizobium sp. TaxID=1871066 RepID=UPI000FE8943C|nr:aminotransferase class V-fold PLP-dependent enzyme [Mesorhizobium sp.]RWH82123.1 MAG: aminotransferase class V-fold PLP-dependent enzyme [Mesorhizobium sp.]RWH85124.1 MAG: aminotransferase class V-fold PLP-dependent enzyme [Mesorhizobium sp.]RWH89879.1 MAG: aminotransferase class V-fold PLP-dependent enzyme [Mesorhizobium sp.]RWH98373.1 MAG: aminotransferase class V-fold PLP-dependent enzyme [Mesorhizobium sp.]RWI04621.1 MAG: aminotransferase class V-fold PLP-dependent enzyme [Mesorhizobium
MLDCQRDLFDLSRSISYLDAAYMSPIPKISLEAGIAGTAVKASPWKMSIRSYYDEVEDARTLAASMINADADDIAIVAATSYGTAVAAANVPVEPGSTIILMENEHPSHRYIWYELAERKGASITIAKRPTDDDWTSAIISTIGSSSVPVAVVAGTMVHWFEGMSVDLEAVASAAREVGACVVVDGTQWVGALPFDVKTVRPDFLVFATYKFLLGPYRLAFLYADRRWHSTGKPLEHHPWNRVGGDKSNFYAVDVPEFLPGARRFDMGERSDFAVLPVAIASLRLLSAWSVPSVFSRLDHLNQLIWDEAAKLDLKVSDKRFRAPHIAIVDLGDRPIEGLSDQLKSNEIFATVRGKKLRISPHVYNDEEDVKRLFAAIA